MCGRLRRGPKLDAREAGPFAGIVAMSRPMRAKLGRVWSEARCWAAQGFLCWGRAELVAFVAGRSRPSWAVRGQRARGWAAQDFLRWGAQSDFFFFIFLKNKNFKNI